MSAAACGKVSTFTDAASDDAVAVDAISAGTVTVTTYARSNGTTPSGEVVSGVDVVVVGRDGAVRDMGTTDASGEATLDVEAGDSVTAVYRDVSGGDLVTYLGVEPGDQLRFGERFGAGGSQTGSMTLNWPLTPASGIEVHHVCGAGFAAGTATSTTIYQYEDCARTPFDALFVAFDLNNPEYIARWGLVENLPFANGTSATLNSWQAPGSFSIDVTGIPPEVTEGDVQVQPLIDGNTGPDVRINAAPTAGSLSGTRPWATGGEGIVASAGFFRDGQFGAQGVFERLPATATAWMPDDPARLPWFGPIIASSAAREITWITAGGGDFDAALVFMSWTDVETDGGVSSYRWSFFVPPGVDELRFPELPGTLMPFLPEDDDFPNVFGFMLDYATVDGYDALRARAEWEVGPFGGLPEEQLWLSISPGFDRVLPPGRPGMPVWTPGPVLAP